METTISKPNIKIQVPLSKLRYFYLDEAIGGPMVSPLSPEVRQGILRVINYLEDTYGVIVKPVIFYQVASIFSFQKCVYILLQHLT